VRVIPGAHPDAIMTAPAKRAILIVCFMFSISNRFAGGLEIRWVKIESYRSDDVNHGVAHSEFYF